MAAAPAHRDDDTPNQAWALTSAAATAADRPLHDYTLAVAVAVLPMAVAVAAVAVPMTAAVIFGAGSPTCRRHGHRRAEGWGQPGAFSSRES